MTNSPVKLRLEDRSYYSGIDEAGVVGNGPNCSTNERVLAATQLEWTYFLLGCTILVPWNALVNGTSFFLSRLAGSPFYPVFVSYWSSIHLLIRLVFQFYFTFTLRQSSPSRHIFTSMIAMISSIASLCLSTFVWGTPSTFFVFILFNAAFLAGVVACLATAVFAGAALLGASFLRVVFSGEAAIGVAVSAVQVASSVIALWGLSPKHPLTHADQGRRVYGGDYQVEEVAARIFFSISAGFLCLTLIAHTWLTRQPFYHSVISATEQQCGADSPDERTELLVNGQENALPESNPDVYRVLRKNLVFLFSLAYTFVVTLAVFPAITARVRPIEMSIHPLLFTAIHLLVYNIGDFLGRYACSFRRLVVWSEKKILAMSLLRTLFIPLLLFCNVERLATTSTLPTIRSDVIFMIIMLTMGYSNGYVATLALLAVSSREHNPRLEGRREDMDVAATLGGSLIIVGLAVGALSSFGVQAMV